MPCDPGRAYKTEGWQGYTHWLSRGSHDHHEDDHFPTQGDALLESQPHASTMSAVSTDARLESQPPVSAAGTVSAVSTKRKIALPSALTQPKAHYTQVT